MRPAIPPTAAPTVPVYPALGSANFNLQAYTYGSSMPAVSIALGNLAANVAQNADIAFENAGDAVLAANAAAASEAQAGSMAAAAAASVGATKWVGSQDGMPYYYVFGAVVWSPANGLLYRCRVPMTALSEPSVSPDEWWLIGGASSPPIAFVAADTVAQPGMHYVLLAAVTLTLPYPAALRDTVLVTDLSMSMAAIVDPVENKIRGANGAMKINAKRVKFSLIYSGPEKGWV